ncbi:MAG: extracellular solute-binding protein [Gaiellaceae bacterium]
MKHRLHLLALLLAFLLAGIGAGCGGDDEGDGVATAEPPAAAVTGSISIMAIWGGEEQASFQAIIDGFTAANPGVTVNYTSGGDELVTVLSTAVEGGNPPDLAAIAQPGLMADFVDQGAIQPIEFAKDAIVENFGESVAQVGQVDGTQYGLLFKAANKSTIWYNVQAFADAGVEPPADWDALLEAAQTIKASGLPAYSIGGADGWTLTDLFENIYIRQAGPDLYDQLATHEIPWTHDSVKQALTTMGEILGDTDNIAGNALQTGFTDSVSNVFSANAKAAMVIEGDFVPGVVESPLEAQTGYNVFTFPSIDGSPPSVVGGGDIFVMFNDNPAAQAFLEYLTTPEASQIWAERGGFSSPNKSLDPSVYPDEILQATAGAIGEAEVFRFDLSDLQPSAFGGTVGQGLFKLFQDFLANPEDVDGIAQQMEDAAAEAFGN